MERKTLLTHCSDEPGLIAKITNICYKHQLNIIHNNEFVDNTSGHFFMRTELEGNFNDSVFMEDLTFALPQNASKKLVDSSKKKVVVLVTKESHCIGDILMKTFDGSLNVDITAVVSNYDILQPLVEKFDIPFRHVSHEGLNREEHETKVKEAIDGFDADYLVLAKYMRILTPSFVEHYHNRIINIHHSFLPAFIGAKPYLQAYERGVKIIGATAHFVTNDLDEGPIIKQDVIPVDHNFSAQDMAQAGRDVEKNVLSKALNKVVNDHVFVYGNKTVIL
ncbi:formyltetrahydrofolate deformylase [Vibrio breoganii]|uniref:Formyltetrahydrofolate deformylase n=1 Tax=Vibrio breoganii TaxID=553239 RepID=A0AAP8MW81_9VIBR|nr:formyltetrahydrofolate deformylase [Vibrio breoganii]MDN3716661.1 formyltetrahydrofolate deformylase [Vibrio breoganii]NMO75148.1 formyltetrahydrofolate deformylase [Vibrio breoganii]NMR71638.1 formyltetrahydrofolate deformylase [Vibrio breoganii]OCH77359.1 formyltetrahydrofolate deformylase [Vibrio breoganii]OED85876.1 formyltetrahydrofolate deformylase [Vibrio breoganii ZF-55]